MPSLDDVPYKGAAKEVLVDLQAHVAYVLTSKLSLPDAHAKEIGKEVATLVLRTWSGTTVYFPRGLVLDETHWKIYQEFDGTNLQELAIKYQLTERWVRLIIGSMKRIDMSRRQCDLFPDAGAKS
jgi:Mor family transcriptional regulator